MHDFKVPERYNLVVGAASVVAAIALRTALDPWLGTNSPYPIFMLVVVVAACLTNTRIALLVAVVGGVAANYLFVAPRHQLALSTRADIVAASTYLATSVAVLLLVRAKSFALRRAEVVDSQKEELRSHLQAIVDSAPAAIVTFEIDRTVKSWNDAAQNIFGWHADEIIGRALPVPACAAEQWESLLKVLMSGRAVTSVESKRVRRDGTVIDVLLSDSPIRDNDGNVVGFVGVIADASELMRARQQREATIEALTASQKRLASQKQVLELAMSAAPLKAVLGCVTHNARELMGRDARTAIFLVDDDGRHLRFAASAGMAEAYSAAMDGFAVGPGQPACGYVAFTGQPSITTDVSTDPLWAPYLNLAREHQVCACWSFPIRSAQGHAMGTLAVYYAEPREPELDDIECVNLLAQTAAVVIEQRRALDNRDHAEGELRRTANRQRLLAEALGQMLKAENEESVVHRILPGIAKQLETEACINCSVGGSGSMPVACSWVNVSDQMPCKVERLQFGNAICGRVAETLKPIVATDIQHTTNEMTQTLRSVGIQCYACFPLVSREKLIGTVSFASSAHQSYDESELELFVILSDYAALAIDRLHALQALRTSEERFRSVFEQTATGITQADLTGRFVLVNDRYCEIVGRSREELLRSQMFDITHPDDIEECADKFQALAEGRIDCAVLEKRYLRPDGTVVWARIDSSSIRDSAGKVVGIAAVCTDITDFKRSHDALKQSEQQFIQMAESLPQLAWMADQRGYIFWFNRRWFEYTGTTLEQVQGWGWRRVHHPDHVDRVVRKIQRCWETGEHWQDTFPLRGADGRYRWFFSRALPIRDEQGRVVRWIGTNTDVTELREAEEVVRRAEALAATGRMAHAMAHEINNPLEAVTNILYLLANDSSLPNALKHRVAIADRELARVSHITKQTLSLYSGSTRPVPIDIRVLLDSVIETFTQRLAGKQIAIRRQYRWNGVIEALANEFQEVCWNLLDNAIEAVGRGGQIVVRVCPAREHRGSLRDGIRITVADNGRGVSASHRAMLFQPFNTPAGRKGTGLGLWVVRDIIARHYGSIRIRTSERPNRSGTCCTIFLPLICSAKAPVQNAVSSVKDAALGAG